MDKNTDYEIIDLKKKISVLEWDIPNIENEALKRYKIKLIGTYKDELSKRFKSRKDKDFDDGW